jgi:hypothetical protein
MLKEYVLFDIRIRQLNQNSYAVDARSSLGGEDSSPFISPVGNSLYDQRAAQLQNAQIDEDGLVELGQILFQSLFQGGVKDVYKLSQGGLKQGQGLRLRFDIDPALTEIAGLPWEFLYDPERGPLATLNMSVVRYLSQQLAPATLAAPLPLKILVTGAVTPPATDVKRELDEVRAALADLEQSGHVTIQVEEHLTRIKLQRLLRGDFQIWHFIGHGALSRDGKSGTLVFEDTGGSTSISARELGIFLDGSGVRLIVLDACGSAKLLTDPYRTIAPALIRAQIPAVVAMQFTVPEEATRAFAGEFYRALAEGLPIDACVTEGRKAVIVASGLRNPDWGIPVIYTRAPDGKLFELPQPSATSTASQGSGININIGSGQRLEHSAINVSEVGNIIKGVDEVGADSQSATDDKAEEIATISQLIKETRRRLKPLQLQKARKGYNTEAEVLNEIEDLEKELDRLQRQLAALST